MSGPVRIIFSDSICLDCGEEGDVRWIGPDYLLMSFTLHRLMGEWCHMEPCLHHPEAAVPRHPGGIIRHHPTDRLCHIHPGHVEVGR